MDCYSTFFSFFFFLFVKEWFAVWSHEYEPCKDELRLPKNNRKFSHHGCQYTMYTWFQRRTSWISCQLRTEDPNSLLPQSFDFSKQVSAWYPYLHVFPAEWLKSQAWVAENSGFETEFYHSYEYLLSIPAEWISALLYPVLDPGRLSCMASINWEDPTAFWMLVGFGQWGALWGAGAKQIRACLGVYALLAPFPIHYMVAEVSCFDVNPLLPQDSLSSDLMFPSITCQHNSAQMSMKDASCWWCHDVNDFTSPRSYLSPGFSLVSSQGCTGKCFITQALNSDRHILYNYHVLKTTHGASCSMNHIE